MKKDKIVNLSKNIFYLGSFIIIENNDLPDLPSK